MTYQFVTGQSNYQFGGLFHVNLELINVELYS